MKIITTTAARKHLSEIINEVRYSNIPVAIGRHNKGEVLLIRFPQDVNSNVSDLTNFNQYAGSFAFLDDEPDIYSVKDLKKRYV